MNNKKQVQLIAAAAALLPLYASAGGHYVPGVEGLQAASAPPPGLYYLAYLVDYDMDSFRAPGGGSASAGLVGGPCVRSRM